MHTFIFSNSKLAGGLKRREVFTMINNVTLQGRLTFDPELRKTTTGISITRIQVASDRPLKNKDGEYKADFIDVVAWRKTAEFISKYFKKGDMINIVGRIEIDNYIDKEGNSRKSFYIRAQEVSFGGNKKEEKNTNPVYAPPSSSSDFESIDDDEDIPF